MTSVKPLALVMSGLLMAAMLALGLAWPAAAKPAPRLSVGASPRVLTEGGVVTLSGRVRGVPSGAKVVAQGRAASGWESLEASQTKTTGRFTLRVRPPAGTTQLRVRVPATRRTRAASSKPVGVTVKSGLRVTTDPGGAFKVVSRGINGSYPYGNVEQPDPRQDGGSSRAFGISGDGESVIFGSTGSNLVAGPDPAGVGFNSEEDLFVWREDQVKSLYQGHGIDPSVRVQVSDNGVWVTYAEFGPNDSPLRLVNTVTGARTILPFKASGDSEGAIPSDDGQTIAFNNADIVAPEILRGGVYLFRRDSGEYQEVAPGSYRMLGMSADASRILLNDSTLKRLHLWEAAIGQIRPAGEPLNRYIDQYGGSISGNGRFVVYQTSRQFSRRNGEVHLLDLESGVVRPIALPPGLGDKYFVEDLQVTDDGSLISLSIKTQLFGAQDDSVWTLDLRTSVLRRLALKDTSPPILASRTRALTFNPAALVADHIRGVALYTAGTPVRPDFEVSLAPDRMNLRLGQSVTFTGIVKGLAQEATVLLQRRKGSYDDGYYWTDVAEATTQADGSFALMTKPIPGTGHYRVLKPRSATRSAGLSETEVVAPYADPEPHAGPIRMVSVSRYGGIGDSSSSNSDISGDGRFVAFWSDSTDSVAGDDSPRADLLVRDTTTGTNQRITRGSDVLCAGLAGCPSDFAPAISRDGRYVAYLATKSPLPSTIEVFEVRLWDRKTGSTTLVAGPAYVGSLDITPDGGFVTYMAAVDDVYRHFLWSRAAGQSREINVPAEPISVSANAQFIAYVDGGNVYRLTRATGAKNLVSHTPGGRAGNGVSANPRISDNGSTIAFASLASDLGPGSTESGSGHFVWDADTGLVTAIDLPDTAIADNEAVTMVDLAGDGSTVLFSTSGGVFGQVGPKYGLAVWRQDDAKFEPVSVDLQQAYVSAFGGSLSFNGNRASFDSEIPNLVSGDPPAQPAYGTSVAYPRRDVFTWTRPIND